MWLLESVGTKVLCGHEHSRIQSPLKRCTISVILQKSRLAKSRFWDDGLDASTVHIFQTMVPRAQNQIETSIFDSLVTTKDKVGSTSFIEYASRTLRYKSVMNS